ncbi:MAG TPA: 4Fe-4S ferredoxin [bacterium]|nr:4Fe-4S ferredoxin [bacterium]
MDRKIIKINEELCDGCGDCVVGCSEGALQIIDGKARLVKEDFCDGFGDCIGACPTGALTIEERETVPFDEEATRRHLLETQGIEAVWRMEEAQKQHEHEEEEQHLHLGCPGSRARENKPAQQRTAVNSSMPVQAIPSELAQWPVQLHLVQPGASFFRDKELVLMSTCGPIASADVHWRYLRGRSVVVGCPKLDDTRNYAAKLGEILKNPSIPKVIVARMQVPCCGGLTMIAQQAVQHSNRHDLTVEEHIIGIDGAVANIRKL